MAIALSFLSSSLEERIKVRSRFLLRAPRLKLKA
jgi:hypothetical protein